MDELERLFTEVGMVELSDDGAVVTLYQCDTCAALVTAQSRRHHYEWHESGSQ